MADVRALGVFQERVKSLFGSLLDVLLVEMTEAYRESFADSASINHCEKCASNRPENNDNKSQQDHEVGVESEESQPLMSFQSHDAVTPLQLTHRESEEPEAAQSQSNALERLTLPEIPNTPVRKPEEEPPTVDHQPETLGMTEPNPDHVVKRENEDFPVTTEEAELELECREKTQMCQTSGENTQAQLKPEDAELHEPVESVDSYLHWNRSSFGVYFDTAQAHQSHLVNMETRERLEPLRKLDNCRLSNRSLMPQLRGCLRSCSVQLERAEILQRPISQSRRLHVCSVCNKIFKHKRSLRRHKHIHTGERTHGCSFCSETFILHKTLCKHEKLHLKRPYSCTQCGKRFKHWRQLRIHWHSHAGEGPFMCSLCGKFCKTLKSLDRHLAYVDHKLTDREKNRLF